MAKNARVPARPTLLACVAALAALLLGACGGGASPTAAPTGGASQAAPTAAVSAAPAEGACALVTVDEAAAFLGGALTKVPYTDTGRVDAGGQTCQYTGPENPTNVFHDLQVKLATGDRAVQDFEGGKGRKGTSQGLIPGLGDDAWFVIDGDSEVTVVARKGSSIVYVHVGPTVGMDAQAVLGAAKTLMATVLTRI